MCGAFPLSAVRRMVAKTHVARRALGFHGVIESKSPGASRKDYIPWKHVSHKTAAHANASGSLDVSSEPARRSQESLAFTNKGYQCIFLRS